MPPPTELFHVSQLPSRVQHTTDGKRRKQLVELEKCKLQELIQYNCDVENPMDLRAAVTCKPLVRTFRRCADGLTVETTAWEEKEGPDGDSRR